MCAAPTFILHLRKRWLQLTHQRRPVPIHKLLVLNDSLADEDALFPKLDAVASTGDSLHNTFLANSFFNTGLGRWSIAVSTLNFLELQIRTFKPNLVLEFGSGISTACLAQYMKELHGDSDCIHAFSIEQDPDFMRETQQLLRALRLDRCAELIYSPLREQVIEGIRTTCYHLSPELLSSVFGNNRPDFIVIDGPAGESSARFGTLPLVQPFLAAGARFFLDDALRDGELRVAQLWSRLRNIRIDGVYLLGKGLLVGQISE